MAVGLGSVLKEEQQWPCEVMCLVFGLTLEKIHADLFVVDAIVLAEDTKALAGIVMQETARLAIIPGNVISVADYTALPIRTS